LKKNWEENVYPNQSKHAFFDSFWNQSLHDGVVTISAKPKEEAEEELIEGEPEESMSNPIVEAATNLSGSESSEGTWELSLYEKIGIGNGEHANNPWLQELPDPVSKVCWDNYITMNPSQMKELNFNTTLGQVQEADLVEISVNGTTIKAPVYPQYGQARGTIGLAVGYGRSGSGKTGDGVGVNAYPLASFADGNISFEPGSVEMSGSKGGYHIATIQTHHTMMGRDPVRETTLEEFSADPKSGNPDTKIHTVDHKMKSPEEINLWQSFPREGHFWNLSIDLTACIGCGACVVGCNSENNVPVVGKDEVRRSREMHWIRIDRYYSSDEEQKPEDDRDLDALEVPSVSGSLSVVFQPIMCQHCNHAPCETVCPVAATTHSNDGLNQMIYNRCVGTKFCLNNCPYKVRRFNWFNYKNDDKFADVNPSQDDWGKMVLNPDVVVRARGVMEKCSMCIQRIQEGKLTAKKGGRKLVDGDIQTACASACPTHAIKFGDVNDETSEMAELKENPRSYYLLEELDTQPSVRYLTKVRNKNKA
jgi:molybdopterin-containing oxidoreductase family iron-sulfur binding subunit